MKMRIDFVTNSSSSSFIVASTLEGEALKEKITKVLGVPESSPLFGVAKAVANNLCDAKKTSLKELLYDYNADTIDELPEHYRNAIKSGMIIREGYASNESEPAELMLCYLAINYQDNELIIYKDEGY